jgi:hypothetical protein
MSWRFGVWGQNRGTVCAVFPQHPSPNAQGRYPSNLRLGPCELWVVTWGNIGELSVGVPQLTIHKAYFSRQQGSGAWIINCELRFVTCAIIANLLNSISPTKKPHTGKV